MLQDTAGKAVVVVALDLQLVSAEDTIEGLSCQGGGFVLALGHIDHHIADHRSHTAQHTGHGHVYDGVIPECLIEHGNDGNNDQSLGSEDVIDGVVGDAIDETVDTVRDTILDIAGIKTNFESGFV